MFEIRIQKDPEQLALTAVEEFAELAAEACSERGRFLIALAGGSSPIRTYELLASEPWMGRVQWSRVEVFWGDERHVPADHADSNYRMAKDLLLDRVGIPDENVHPVPTSLAPLEAAMEYERVLREWGDPPQFDLTLLGMGADGHTASLFPHAKTLDEQEKLVLADFIPSLNAWRITVTLPLINASRRVMFLISGEGKAEAVRQVFEGKGELPAQKVQPREGELIWLLDEAAASALPGADV